MTTAIPGLSLNLNARNKANKVHHFERNSLRKKRPCTVARYYEQFPIPTQSNNDIPCSVEKLLTILQQLKPQIFAIVYCARLGTESILKKQVNGGILIFDIKTNLLSHCKKNKKHCTKEFL